VQPANWGLDSIADVSDGNPVGVLEAARYSRRGESSVDVALRTYSGDAKRVIEAELSALRGALRETMCLPDDADYDTARRV
jgi:hypothetical protein